MIKLLSFSLLLLLLLLILIIYLLSAEKEKKELYKNNDNLKLDCVLTAVNETPEYIEFIPVFIKAWKKFYPKTHIKIVLIANKIPNKFLKYSNNIILHKPLPEVSTVFTSQFIRLLYPCLLNYEDVMITDIDNIPLNNTYFSDNIKNINKKKWVNFRDWKGKEGTKFMQIAMCWQIATPKIWREVFNINSIKDVNECLIENNKKNKSWYSDQIYLYKKVMKWNSKTQKYIVLKDKNTKYNRLDRINLTNIKLGSDAIYNIKKNVNMGIYSDFHLLTPYIKYKDIINFILD